LSRESTAPPPKPPRPRRKAGILLHPTSLPGPFGIGDFGPAAAAFLDWAAEAGQSLWQVLPLGPTAWGDSPYGALSSFAGNPLLISPEALVADGLLPASELAALPRSQGQRVEFEIVRTWKEALLRAAFASFEMAPPPWIRDAAAAFVEAPENRTWLPDWTLFSALKSRLRDRPWSEWPRELRQREPGALATARRELASEIAFHAFVQWLFHRQWERLRDHARELDIEILGDLPIYAALDSADVWARPDLFELDADGHPTAVAGVPPDAFSEDGQLWGSPVYRWERHREEGFAWWAERLGASLRLADRVRLDHFRGFEGFWAVPAGAETAREGRWEPGPGLPLFRAIKVRLGLDSLPLIAEDLGVITDEVRTLVAELGLPGMKVLQFAFGVPDSDFLPHHHVPDAVVYTGTHDNDTCRGWFASAGPEERRRALDYLGLESSFRIERAMIRVAYTSVAKLAVVPIQDVLGLGSEARMNTPGIGGGGWRFRVREEDIRPGTGAWLRRLAEISGRLPAAPEAADGEEARDGKTDGDAG